MKIIQKIPFGSSICEKDRICLPIECRRFGAAFAFIPLFPSEAVSVWSGGAFVRRGSSVPARTGRNYRDRDGFHVPIGYHAILLCCLE